MLVVSRNAVVVFVISFVALVIWYCCMRGRDSVRKIPESLRLICLLGGIPKNKSGDLF